MNVLLSFTDLEIGGASRHVVELANHIVRCGHRAWVAANDGPLRVRLERRVEYVNLPFDRVVPETISNPRNVLAVAKILYTLQQLIAQAPIDLIHAHEIAVGSFARAARLHRHTPVLLSSHGCSEERWPSYGRRARLIADYFIGVSRDTVKRLAYYGCPAERIVHINYGIQKVVIASYVADAQALRRSWMADPEGKIVATVARLHPQKGHDVLLDAIPQVLKVHPNTRFLWVGDGPLRAALESRVKAMNLERYVIFAGSHMDPYPYLCASDLFCLPSLYEALPLSIVEAYRTRLPVVASAVGGVPEIVLDGETGRLVPSADPSALAEALIDLLDDSSALRQMGDKAERFGNSPLFDPEVVHRQITAIYRRILKR